MQAASEKMRQLDEKNDNGELSDGSDQEPELESMQVSERMDGLAEYEHNLPLHRIKYRFFIERLRNINASSNYQQASKKLQEQLSLDPEWRNEEKSAFDFSKLLATTLLKDEAGLDLMNWKKTKLIGLYICKQSSN